MSLPAFRNPFLGFSFSVHFLNVYTYKVFLRPLDPLTPHTLSEDLARPVAPGCSRVPSWDRGR